MFRAERRAEDFAASSLGMARCEDSITHWSISAFSASVYDAEGKRMVETFAASVVESIDEAEGSFERLTRASVGSESVAVAIVRFKMG